MWITNSLQADWICLLANTSEGKPHQNKSLIIVPMKTPGITIEKKIHKIGMWASDTGLIHFDNVRVPQRNLIGMAGAGRSEEHTSELQSLMRISYAVLCL